MMQRKRTISDCARHLGMTPTHLWKLIHERQLVPKPRCKHRMRRVYDEAGFEELVEAIEYLRSEHLIERNK
jgi:hypothetical protein